MYIQGWIRTGTARNAVPVKFFTTGTAFRLRFCRFATAYIGPNSFIFDEEYGPNSFISLDSKSIYRVGQKTAKLNGANAVSIAIVKHVLENIDNFWQVK